MSKKKRPNTRHAKSASLTPSAPPPKPVMHGNVFATFLLEAQSIGNECEARRRLQARIATFLDLKGLTAEFEAWNKERDADGPARPEPR